MQCPDITTNENERLAELQSYDILDTAPEVQYDDLTLLASSICRVPISLISFVDSERQWFKAAVGISISETPRNISFCGHAILGSQLFVVNDTTKDDRFADNPLVVEDPKVRFYAGAPLISPTGAAIGTLCVIDRKPNQLDELQRQALEVLARQVVSQLELRKSRICLEEQFRSLQSVSRNLIDREAQLAETAKLCALGEMAGGIAHEINNPLAIVVGFAKIASRRLGEPNIDVQLIQNDLEKVVHASERVVKIVKGLRDFARSGSDDPVEVAEVATLVSETINLCRERFRNHGVDLQVDGFEVGKLSCRRLEISQAVLNLLHNALEAVQKSEAKVVEVRFAAAGGFAEISVIDSGPGVDPGIVDKIMNPFFSTKPPTEGPGLGLSIAHGIAVKHGGSLEFDRSSPKTRFVLRLPLKEGLETAKVA